MNFGTEINDVSVTIHNVECIIQSVEDGKIVCETEPYTGPRVSTQPLIIIGNGRGKAVFSNEASTQFWYIDRWSSPFSWGCDNSTCKPNSGDIVVIPEGITFMLDETTPILAVLIIDGGTLIWDRVHGLELRAEYIIITNNGTFQIGTEDDLFCDPSGDRSIPFDAGVTLYGHQLEL